MKWLLILFCFISVTAFSQEDTTRYGRYDNIYGMRIPRLWPTISLRLPDTTRVGAKAGNFGKNAAGTKAFMWNGTSWNEISGAASSTYLTPLQFGVRGPGDTVFIKRGIDTAYKINDSTILFAFKNGTTTSVPVGTLTSAQVAAALDTNYFKSSALLTQGTNKRLDDSIKLVTNTALALKASQVGTPNAVRYFNAAGRDTSSNNLSYDEINLSLSVSGKIQGGGVLSDGFYLSENIDGIGAQVGLVENTNFNKIAVFNGSNNEYKYANGAIKSNPTAALDVIGTVKLESLTNSASLANKMMVIDTVTKGVAYQDLPNTALALKVPYTGATGNVNLGINDLKGRLIKGGYGTSLGDDGTINGMTVEFWNGDLAEKMGTLFGTTTVIRGWTLPDATGTIALRAPDSTASPQNMIYQDQQGLFHKAAVPSGSGGTVTSISTNAATGITGGPIVTTGTISNDTTIIRTVAAARRDTATLGSKITSNTAAIGLKLNISDTAAMKATQTLEYTTTKGKTTTQGITFNSNSQIIYNPTAAFELLRINRPTAYSGAMPFNMTMANATNGDGTFNSPVVWGFNPYGSINAAEGGNHLSMEPDYRPGGAKYKEFHYEIYHPFNAENSRLFSSTYVQRDSLGNSTNQWDFRGNMNFYDLKNNSYATINALKGGYWNAQFNSIGGITTSGIKFSGNSADINNNTYVDGLGTLPNFVMQNWNSATLPNSITTKTLTSSSANGIYINNILNIQRTGLSGTINFNYDGATNNPGYIKVDYGTGEWRDFLTTGGYYRTLYAEGAEVMRISNRPPTTQNSGVHIGGTGAFNTPSAMLQVDGTNQGFLPPRLTTTQRDAMYKTIAATITAAGSGGTNGTYALTITGGSANYAPTGTYTIAGGVLTAITFTSTGSYFTATIPTLSFPLGGITGATATATLSPATGLVIHNSTTTQLETFDGLQWTNKTYQPYITKTAAYTATASDYTIDCTTGTFTVTLPTAVGIAGRMYVIINSGAGTITVSGTGGQIIGNGGAATTLSVLAGESYSFQSTNAAWRIF